MIEQPDDDRRTPFQRMADLAAKVINVSKEEIDRREQKWKDSRQDATTRVVRAKADKP